MFTRLPRTMSFVVLLTLAAATCGGDGVAGPAAAASATSQLCTNVRGAKAIFWDMQNGTIRTDLPGGVPPTVRTIAGDFFHPAYPPLSFIYPSGWAPQTISDAQTVGVNLVRQDGRGLWRWVGAGINGFVDPAAVLDFEIGQVLSFLGAGNDVRTLCTFQNTTSPVPGIALANAAILFEVGGSTVLVNTQVSTVDGLAFSQIAASVAVGPTAEYDQLIFDTFLAIGFQLLYGRASILDSDSDGVPDVNDAFPNDRNRR